MPSVKVVNGKQIVVEALDRAGLDARAIDGIVFASTTGIATPTRLPAARTTPSSSCTSRSGRRDSAPPPKALSRRIAISGEMPARPLTIA